MCEIFIYIFFFVFPYISNIRHIYFRLIVNSSVTTRNVNLNNDVEILFTIKNAYYQTFEPQNVTSK